MSMLHWFYRTGHRTCAYGIGFTDRVTEVVEKKLVLQQDAEKQWNTYQFNKETRSGNPKVNLFEDMNARRYWRPPPRKMDKKKAREARRRDRQIAAGLRAPPANWRPY